MLFLVFVNDLLSKMKSECLAYADDIKIFRRISNHQDCEALQSDIKTIVEWCDENSMSLNTKKCQVITFSKNSKNIINYDYTIRGVVVDRVKVVRDLGVMFDSVLSFRPHYDHICNKANRLLSFILRNAKPFKDPQSLLILYYSLVRSILEYCSSVWSPIYNTHIDRIESVQRRFVRVLSARCGLRRKLPNYNGRLAHFHMKSLERRRWVADLSALHKIANGSFDIRLLDQLNFKIPTRSVRTPQLFSIPSSNNNVSENNPLSRMCNQYNAICHKVDLFLSSYKEFRNHLYKL